MSPNPEADNVDALIENAHLPPEVRERIRGVVESSRARAAARLDVARELVAHFEDGLASGRSPQQLLDSFGDEKLAARLISRAQARAARSGERRDGGEHRRSIAGPGPMRAGSDGPLAGLRRDLAYAIRRLRRAPGFAATAILSLALGIGANTAIFTLVNAILLREPPFAAPEELWEIYIDAPEFAYNVFSYPDYVDLRNDTASVFAGVVGSAAVLAPYETEDGVELLFAELVTGDYFPTLGLGAELGRTLGPGDDVAPGAHPVVMLSHGFWRRAFDGSPQVVGTELRLNGTAYEVVGVVAEEYTGNLRGLAPDLFVPVMMWDQLEGAGESRFELRGSHSLFVRARMRHGVTIDEARARLDAVAGRLQDEYPEYWSEETGFVLVPTRDVVLYPPVDAFIMPAASVFMGLVGLVLLVACANLASFLLARAMDRGKEVAVRLALGATRWSLVRQLLSETVLLAVVGGAAGVLLAAWLMRLLLEADLPMPFPLTLDLRLDPTVLGFSFAVSLAAGVLFGLAPALHATRSDVASILKEGGRGATSRRLSLRSALVVAQVAFSFLLLIAAGLFLRSLQETRAVDPGFGREPAAIVGIATPLNRYSEAEARALFYELVDRIRELPAVEAVGIIDNLHLNPLNTQFVAVNVPGVEPPPGRDEHVVDRASVDPGFFDAVGIRLLQGRSFNAADNADAESVAIISEAMARRFWPDGSAVGSVFRGGREQAEYRVVGVVSDAKVRSLGEAPRPVVYFPFEQLFTAFGSVVARTSADPQQIVQEVLTIARQLDPELMVWETKTMERHLAVMLLPARLAAAVLAVFAGLALLLASIGLYGIVSYAVSRRTREVGIRISLGADSGSVVRLLMSGGIRLVVVGVAIGAVLAAVAARVVGTLLFGVSPFDTRTFIAVPLALAAVALLAAWIPARRASRVDPVSALRAE